MALAADTFDLDGLRLSSGEGRRIELHVRLGSFELGSELYPVVPELVPVRLEISRTTGQGYALRLRFSAALEGPCMRCMEPAAPEFQVDAIEVSQPGAGEELDSPYLEHGTLQLAAWARDELALTLPAAVLCRADCAGLCPICGIDLNRAGEHHHEPRPDPRWARLAELRFEAPAGEEPGSPRDSGEQGPA
jgi:uncharacterized protein